MDIQHLGVAVDTETRRKKQQALILKMVERKVRSRAKELYKTRGEVDGHALQDWVQAESEVVDSSALAPLYRRHIETSGSEDAVTPAISSLDSSACETSA